MPAARPIPVRSQDADFGIGQGAHDLGEGQKPRRGHAVIVCYQDVHDEQSLINCYASNFMVGRQQFHCR